MLIKINLIAEEVEKKRHTILKKKAMAAYVMVWIITLFTAWLNYNNKTALIQSQVKEIKSLEKKIDEVVPEFYQAARLFKSLKGYEVKLAKTYKQFVETGFLLESMQSISSVIPQNFWLEEIKLISLENKEFDDKIKEKKEEVKVLIMNGKLFFATGNKNSHQVEVLVSDIQNKRPFNVAKSKVNLRDIKVGMENKNYFYNFSVQFAWLEPYLF